MSGENIDIRIRGRVVKVPAIHVDDRTIIVRGKWLKMATLRDEELVEGEIDASASFLAKIKESRVKVDMFSFSHAIQESTPKYGYFFEWDNVAAASTKNFADWWKKLPQESRKNTRRAARMGVSVRLVQFGDDFVKGIKEIYDESPIRQSRRFWHYGKDFEMVKVENGTYLERSDFIGAYYGAELVGFMKLVYVDGTAQIIQILSKIAHYDKRPMNALITKAVEVCDSKGIAYLVYSKFAFGNKQTSDLAEFKRRNGFEQLNFPRYYIPLTFKGRIALKLKLHRDLIEILPGKLISIVLYLRSRVIRLVPAATSRARTPTCPGPLIETNGVRLGGCSLERAIVREHGKDLQKPV